MGARDVVRILVTGTFWEDKEQFDLSVGEKGGKGEHIYPREGLENLLLCVYIFVHGCITA